MSRTQIKHSSKRITVAVVVVAGWLLLPMISWCDTSGPCGLTSETFRRNFANPPNEYRLIQYQLNGKTLEEYPQYGIGGFTAFFYRELYQSGTNGAKKIGPLVDAAQAKGMKVWLADDFGYPSGMAGGKVVEENPAYEVRGLAMVTADGSGKVPAICELPAGAERFVGAVLYPLVSGTPDMSRGTVVSTAERRVETVGLDGAWRLCAFATVIRNTDNGAQGTMSQFKHSGRYPDLMNPDAVASFINKMHAPIVAQISNLPSKVEGFYANEPNLLQLHWSQQRESPFACLPWTAALPGKFKQMHGYDLLPVMAALYGGEDTASRRVRMHFHQTVAELFSKNFAGQIREWCNARGIHSSGHFLLDEHLCMHVANYGDCMKFVSEFDVPAIDTAIPNPNEFGAFAYHFARVTSSVAIWKQRDTTMCLLDPIIGGYGLKRLCPAMPLLLNSVNMTFFNGFRLFSSYLPLDRKADGSAAGYTMEEYRAFNEYVGRIAATMHGTQRDSSVALYYPIAMFQADYRPTNQFWSRIIPLHKKRQGAWDAVAKALLGAGIEYDIVHPEGVSGAGIKDGVMKIGAGSYHYLIMQQVEFLPRGVLSQIKAFEAGGGTVMWVDVKPELGQYAAEDAEVVRAMKGAKVVHPEELASRIKSTSALEFSLNPEAGADVLTIGRFRRDGRPLCFLVNRTDRELDVRIKSVSGQPVHILDPSTGGITEVVPPAGLKIGAYRSMLIAE